MRFAPDQIPIAYTMFQAAQRAEPGAHQAHQHFICCWTAFEVICAAIAAQAGPRPTFALRHNGTLETRKVGKIKIAQTHTLSELAQIDLAFARFSEGLKHGLVIHPSTAFFVHRTPTWLGQRVETDGFGQRLNGVIDVARSADGRYPVWSPLPATLYKQYLGGNQDSKMRDLLARQVLDLLCAVRHNLTQGRVQAGDEGGAEVVAHALPLLRLILADLMDENSSSKTSPPMTQEE